MNYYLARDYKVKRIHDAGSKARMDIEDIMLGMGMTPVGRHHGVSRSRIRHFLVTLLNVLRLACRVGRDDVLVLQYPTKYYRSICRIAHRKGARVVTFIHDLDCFRQRHHTVAEEMGLMNLSDALIGCNPTVCQWLTDNGFVGHGGRKIVVPMHVFDFLSDARCADREAAGITRRVVYAGQLAPRKNRFLYSWGRHIHGFTVNVYGRGFDASCAAAPERFDVKGFMLPDELIGRAEGDFGLVWDGGSADGCTGDWGGYLALNTPHKTSLYIRCGLPVIIWKQAAMAPFIEEQGIGIAVNSLREIEKIYERLTPEDYGRLCHNVKRVGRLMASGHYFRTAVSEAITRLTP